MKKPAKKEKGALSEQIYLRLKDMIYSGQLVPNETLSLQKLAGEFNVSLTPINASLSRLAKEGLVIKQPNRSCIVSGVSSQYFKESYTIGALLEGMAAYLAFHNIGSKELHKMEKTIEKMKTIEMPEGALEWKSLNEEFHGIINGCCNIRDLRALIREYSWRLYRYYFLVLALPGSVAEFTAQHETIVKRFKEGDPKSAREAVENHIKCAGEKVMKYLAWVFNS